MDSRKEKMVATTTINPPKDEKIDGSHLASLLKDLKVQRIRLRENAQGDIPSDYKTWTLHRKALRNVFLKLLFRYPFSSRTSGVENELWNETSLNGVDYYRKQLKRIDTAFKEQQQKAASIGWLGQSDREKTLSHQHHRLSGSFRSFLESEILFWRELMGRITRVFDVHEAKPYLQLVNIVWDANAPQDLYNREAEVNTGLDRIAVGFKEELDLELQGRMPANRQRLIEIIHKCLVSCGDLARYIELYKEEPLLNPAMATPAALSRGGKRRGRGGRGGAPIDRKVYATATTEVNIVKRDYRQAKIYYEQARSLLPSHGQPSNQIAVLYNYDGDQFASTYHYYRALCVTSPFKQARKNMESMLTRAVQKWEVRDNRLAEISSWEEVEVRKKALFELLVILQGHFFESLQRPAPRKLFENCRQLLSSVMSEKGLSADVIVQVVVVSIACLWTRRLWRGDSLKRDESTISSGDAEQDILQHLLVVMTVFLEVSTLETREAQEAVKRISNDKDDEESEDQSRTLAKSITAVFRRMLPAMRISSKWIKSHVEYMERSRKPTESGNMSGDSIDGQYFPVNAELNATIDTFWKRYVEFVNVIRFAFPFDQLPKLGTVGQSGMTSLDFEEDRDMRGFLPMKKAMLIDAKTSAENNDEASDLMHPNEEHLIRIADLLIDAKVIAEIPSSPITFNDEKNIFQLAKFTSDDKHDNSIDLARSSVVDVASNEQDFSHSYDSKWENGSESTEDAVDLAMRAVDERRRALGDARVDGDGLNGKDDEDDEEDDGEIILIPSTGRPITSTDTPKISSATPANSTEKAPLTAQHLLLQMLNGVGPSKATSANVDSLQSTSQSQLLFGGNNFNYPQGTFTAPMANQYSSGSGSSGTWSGVEAAHFVNQQQQQQTILLQQRQQQSRQNSNAFAHSALDPSSPWNPPGSSKKAEGWR